MKRLIVFAMLALLSFKGYTQTLKSDSTLIPNGQLETVFRAAEKGKVYKEKVESKDRQIAILNSRIDNKDSAIEILKTRVAVNQNIATTFESNYKLEQIRTKELQSSYDAFKKAKEAEIKKLNRQKTTKTIAGIAAGAAVGILVGVLLIN